MSVSASATSKTSLFFIASWSSSSSSLIQSILNLFILSQLNNGLVLTSCPKVLIKVTHKIKVLAVAYSKDVKNISSVKILFENNIFYKLLFDHGHGLQERSLREQFF